MSTLRPAGSHALSCALATARWKRQYAVSEPGLSTASGLAAEVATLDSIRRPDTGSVSRRAGFGGAGQTSAPRWRHGGHRGGAFPADRYGWFSPSLRSASPGRRDGMNTFAALLHGACS